MPSPYLAPRVVLSVPVDELLARVSGFQSGFGCQHVDITDGDCDSSTGESHENGHGT